MPVGRAGERLDVGDRDAHVFQPQRLERLEAEHVADDRRGEVRDRAFLKQVDVVGDVGDVLARRARDRIDAIGFGLIVLVRREPVGPDHRPGCRRRLAGDGRGCLDRVDAVLRGDPERAQYVGLFRLVLRIPVAHLGVGSDAGFPAALAVRGGGFVAHLIASPTDCFEGSDAGRSRGVRSAFDGPPPGDPYWLFWHA